MSNLKALLARHPASHHALTLRTSFLTEFLPLTEHGLVLAFDTAEVLAYERQPFAGEPDDGALPRDPAFERVLELVRVDLRKEATAELWDLQDRVPRKRSALTGSGTPSRPQSRRPRVCSTDMNSRFP